MGNNADRKVCKKCNVEKISEMFYKCEKRKSGLRSQCIKCMKKVYKKYYYLPHIREKMKEKMASRDKETRNARIRDFKKSNPEYACYNDAKRRLSIKQQHPKWANDFFIKEAYSLSQLRTNMTGFVWHVDHIIPLKSKIVSGLHTEHNLSVIPGQLNLRKSNKLIDCTTSHYC